MPTTVTIDLNAIGGALTRGQNYRIALDENFVREQGNNFTPSPTTSNLISFRQSKIYEGVLAATSQFTATTQTSVNKPYTATLSVSAGISILGDAVVYLSNVASSYTYNKNSENDIFSSVANTPQISDPTDGTFQITLTVGLTVGKWSSVDNPTVGASSLSFTGNKTSVNNWLQTIRFYPVRNYTGSTDNILINLIKQGTGGYSIEKRSTLIYSGTGSFVPRTYAITTSGGWTPTFEEYTYGLMDYAIIAGGGSGSGCYTGSDPAYSPCGGSGGGAGSVVVANGQNISNQYYPITIGAGGTSVSGFTSGNTGGNTTAFGQTVPGGGAGVAGSYTIYPPTTGRGGNSTFQGAPMRLLSTNVGRSVGGGGGGAGGHAVGYNVSQDVPSGDGIGSAGGAGVTFRGTTYGVGGPGNGPNGSSTTASTTYGSGGRGNNQTGSINTAGRPGAVIIYVYSN